MFKSLIQKAQSTLGAAFWPVVVIGSIVCLTVLSQIMSLLFYIAAVAILVGAVWYFVDDDFSTWVQAKYKEYFGK